KQYIKGFGNYLLYFIKKLKH
ncbi:glycosyl transferase family 8, partial [Escherichia coli]|nr:glycosyl transferase family 8 [Escherichia coli]EEX2873328.1 glycosyl transferase family 8 [Escherichia coli]